MAINLIKGQRIDLTKHTGETLKNFCVGCNWGAIVIPKWFGLSSETKDVDLDLSCIMTNASGQMVDHVYSPLYRPEFLAGYGMPLGKTDSIDRALHHSGDDRSGDKDGDDGLDNEIISVDLDKVSKFVTQIFFFLNNCGKEDFSQIPYAAIRMYEGTPSKVREVFAKYDVAAEPRYAGTRALIMGKLYRYGNAWKFAAIGDAVEDRNICETIRRILKNYVK